MTDFMIVEIKFKTNEPSFFPVKIGVNQVFIMKEDQETKERRILQLTVENNEQYVGMPFYEFWPLDDAIEQINIGEDIDFHKFFRDISSDRWVLREDESFVISIKTRGK
jgi:hypothetical protein